MDKAELIEALRETGIVNKENDANGVRVLVTLNDNETLQQKADAANRLAKLQKTQFWALLITSVCLIASTTYSFVSGSRGNSEENYLFYKEQYYLLRVSKKTGTSCYISTAAWSKEIATQHGLEPCGE